VDVGLAADRALLVVEIAVVLGEGILVVTVAAAVVVVVAWEAGDVRGRVCVGVGGAAAIVSSGRVSAACWRPPSAVRRAVRVLVLSSGALVAE
jgi:hypothetical protein